MIDYETYCKIHDAHHKQGLTASQVARELRLHRRTVSHWLSQPRFRPRQSAPRKSKLDDFKGQIVRQLQSHPYTSAQIFQQLRQGGYTGGISIVKQYVSEVRPPRKPAFLSLTFAPGECAQVDWGQFGSIAIGNTRRRLSFFVMVLCHSRMLYVQFTPAETMEHFLDCHVNAFNYFGGATARTMVDNLKSAVLQHSLGQQALLNPRYKDLADHYGTEIAACGVGQPQEKGRVENAVAYVKKNFLAGRQITGLDSLNADVRQWLDTIANVRVHGTTRQKPLDLFAAEKAALRPLPICLYDVAAIRTGRANSQFRVVVETNRYSVPAEHAGAPVTLKLYPGHVCIYRQDKLIARHVRSYDRHQDIEHPDHPRTLLRQRRKAADQKLLQRLLALTPRAERFYQALAERKLNVTHHVRKIVALSEIYGIEPAARAIDDALEFAAFSCEYIANLLEQRRRVLPEPGALHVTRRQDLLELELPEPDMSAYGGASAPPVPPAPSTVEGSNVEGGQGHVPDEVAKQQQPAQMTLDFKTAPDPQVNPDPNVNPDPV
jgi:transposase